MGLSPPVAVVLLADVGQPLQEGQSGDDACPPVALVFGMFGEVLRKVLQLGTLISVPWPRMVGGQAVPGRGVRVRRSDRV